MTMRLHVWETDEDLPEVVILDDGEIQILDYAHRECFEIGDQIQYLTDIGTSVYFVVDVECVWDPEQERELRIVTIQGA